MKTALIPIAGLLVLAACSKSPENAAPAPAAPAPQSHPVRGVIREIPQDRRHVRIKHEAIPGYMAAMTMDFNVRDTNLLAGYAPGDEITFTLVTTPDDDWIENLSRVGKHGLSGPPGWHVTEPALNDGDLLPDFEFTAETGRPVRFSDFRGRATAFTFFFTRCPLPTYCPRMNRCLSEARDLLRSPAGGPTNWQLLSISFDPVVDQPPVLTSYARLYRGTDPDRWLFAVASTNTLAGLAPKVDLSFWMENDSISHNLRTVVLDGDGRIFKQFDGNEWTPAELAEAIRKAAQAR